MRHARSRAWLSVLQAASSNRAVAAAAAQQVAVEQRQSLAITQLGTAKASSMPHAASCAGYSVISWWKRRLAVDVMDSFPCKAGI
jgi:hypothetical protein